MKILILGCGAVGSVLVKLLSKEKRVKSVYCADIRFREKFGRKVKCERVDFTDKNSLMKVLNKEKFDAVVNVTHPKFNLILMESCLKAKVNYIDTAAFWDLDPNPNAIVPYKMEQTDLDEQFLKNKLIGLIESGVAPGIDNLLAAECASKLDEVDYIKIRMVEDTGSKELFFSWNKEWLLDELCTKPMIYENGKFKLVEHFGAEEEYDFPKPIGKRKTCYFAQDEVGSIPLYVKTKNLDVKIYDNNINVSKILVALGLLSDRKVKVDGVWVVPINFLLKILPEPVPGEEKKFPNARFAMSVEAIGRLKGKKKTVKHSVIFPAQKDIGKLNLNANFISYPTALCVKLFLMAIPKIAKRGVFPPEAIEKEAREEILEELDSVKSIVFKKEILNR